jgi:catechol 2,3-dioxygenase-like lactoylglutathione lyase family enzyme/DNA-binding CsgD family transcriptional regulator
MAKKRPRGRPAHDDVLTPAEWRVAHAAQHGLGNRRIAAAQGVSLDAVKFHMANILAKLGLPDRKALRRWFCVPRASALGSGKETTTVKARSLGKIGQISRSVDDIDAAVRWYGEVLGLPHLYTFGQMAFFDCDGTRLLLTRQVAASAAESILYFRVDDILGAYERLTSCGVEFLNVPHMVHRHGDGTEEWMAFFKDPEGRPLALMAQLKP